MAIAADTPAQSRRFKRRLKIPFTLLVDPKLRVIKAWGLRQDGLQISVPSTFVIRSNGRIVWRRISTNVWDRATVAQIRQVLGGLNPRTRPPSTRKAHLGPL